MIRERKRPYLWEGMFWYYESPEDFDRKIETCDKALKIAEIFENPYLAGETRIVQSYVKLAKYIYEIAEQVATDDLLALESQAKLRKSLKYLEEAGDENITAIKEWRKALGPEPWHFRLHDAYKSTEKTVNDIISDISGKYFF